MEQVVSIFLKEGVLGAALILFVYLYLKERADNRTLQEKRIGDMKEASKSYDDLAEKAMEATGSMKSAFDALRAAVEQLLRSNGK